MTKGVRGFGEWPKNIFMMKNKIIKVVKKTNQLKIKKTKKSVKN